MTRTGSKFLRVLRTIAWALFFAFAFGLLVGTWLRSELEKPVRYIGARLSVEESAILHVTLRPGDVGQSDARIFMTRQYEKKIG